MEFRETSGFIVNSKSQRTVKHGLCTVIESTEISIWFLSINSFPDFKFKVKLYFSLNHNVGNVEILGVLCEYTVQYNRME